ncbi:U32 family peptidase [bacterium]|nr:U32 family peptidase [bacterium]
MKEINIIAPVKKPDDIFDFCQNTSCKSYYVYYDKFLDGNFEYVNEFVSVAKKNDAEIYINFKHDIVEEQLPEIKKFLKFLKTAGIDGIFINSFAVLESIKVFKLPFKVIIDSYFDIHNLAGIDFMNSFHKIDGIIITEEIYLKNISKIKKFTKLPLAIDSDNLPWCAEDIIKLKAIDSVIIKGKFKDSEDILEGIELIEKILDKPKLFKKQKLPFKHVRQCVYQTNHFSGDVVCAQGKDFKFSRNIQSFDWDTKRVQIPHDLVFVDKYKINLRLTALNQVKELEKYIKKIGKNPIYSVEYGEIVSTADLSSSSFSKVVTKVKKFCHKYGIKFQLSTPKILIERDFDRTYEYEKELLLSEPAPDSLIINNIGYFWSFINDADINQIPFEIGQGINLLNSMSIKCLNNLGRIDTVDFTSFSDYHLAIRTLKKIKNDIPNRKYTIGGNVRVSSMGLCPLNNDSAVVSRLSCAAPCHNGIYALKDPSLNKVFPFVCDGFCRMHMFEDRIMDDFSNVDELYEAGINEFVFDFSALPPKYIPLILNKFFTLGVKK